jgi:hypothetical protein
MIWDFQKAFNLKWFNLEVICGKYYIYLISSDVLIFTIHKSFNV